MITQLLNKNNTKKENVHKNHRKRLRAELRHMNFQVVEDYKILEFILFYTNAQKDTNPIAHNLINTFGNFANVVEASYEQLMQIEGVGEATASFLKGFVPLFELYSTQKANSMTKLTTTQDYVKHYGNIIKNSSKEYFGIIPVNNRYEGSKFVKMEVGINDTVEVKFNHVYNTLKDTEYKKVILMHNHPSGNPNPSSNDLTVTSLLAYKLNVLNIEILDSIIVSTNGHFSFKEHGYIDYIAKNIEKSIDSLTFDIKNKTKK